MSSGPLIHSFAPIIGEQPRVLILGSMPGKVSLDSEQYYAHPRNAFWPMMSVLLGFDQRDAYPQRCKKLVEAKIAVWDVLQYCFRDGSLDADIKATGMSINNFIGFFESHPSIERVLLNGKTAHKLYQKKVWPGLAPKLKEIPFYDLPSTSPANARLNLCQKIERWRPHFPPGIVTLADHQDILR